MQKNQEEGRETEYKKRRVCSNRRMIISSDPGKTSQSTLKQAHLIAEAERWNNEQCGTFLSFKLGADSSPGKLKRLKKYWIPLE